MAQTQKEKERQRYEKKEKKIKTLVEKLELTFHHRASGNRDENWWIITLNGSRVAELIL